MSLFIAVQMDPIENIDIQGDSTFALMLEARRRGHKLFYYTPDNLSCYKNKIVATGHHLTSVQDEKKNHYTVGKSERVLLSEFDVVLLRQDPPFDMNYITSTHLLERIHPKTLVVNDPSHVRNAPEKLFILDYSDLMPPTLITRSLEETTAFRKEYKDIIIKPLYGNGGAGVFRLTPEDSNINSLIEMFHEMYREPFIVQQYLPDVRLGDKRIILVDGEIAGAINRVPAKNETRSNMHVGGRPEAIGLTKRDLEICDRLKPELKRRGLIFTGIDVIGNVMTEINVTSPTGIREIERFNGTNIASMIWDSIETKVSSN